LEVALACHHRVAADHEGVKLGLPEAQVGLLPGAGGTQRLPRLIGASEALQLMLRGSHIGAARALELGAVHEVAAPDRLVEAAKAWLRSGASPVQPWDEKRFKVPGGQPYSPQGMPTWIAGNAIYRKESFDNYPAQRAIMSCVYEGLMVPMDVALRIEARYFTKVCRSPQAANMIRSLFLNKQALDKGARRPAGVAPVKIARLGILGAGMMGSGIAYVSALAGIDTVLVDRDPAAAEKGKAHSGALMDKAISRGRADAAVKAAVLARIAATGDYDALEGCDLVIEAVFEDRDLKAEVTKRAEATLGETAIFASNTSTLPITGLAQASVRPANFIGIHFFSPVDKMQLVEVIMGKETSSEALACALDYVRAIRKTPIVVNDSRGFFTSRVVRTYIAEGHAMLAQGVPSAMIENAGRQCGMPVGPLALNDEVALDLSWKIIQATKADLGEAYEADAMDAILEELVDRRQRFGRKNGKGFYDYSDDGEKRLWPGLAELQAQRLAPDEVDFDDLKQRFLTIQALETARCFEEGVLTDVRDADIGAIFGFGFAPFTGGPLSYIDTLGAAPFVERCERFARAYGPRFAPNALLRDLAVKADTFYERFAPPGATKSAA
jgi:3-hydroxyacyl-CoA dehydrogenase/enoyl-CoA hydratase/3-hydroxybutyryl-CoA epimerase